MSASARKDAPEQAGFRAHCQQWLRANVPPPAPVRLPQTALEIMTREQLDYLCAWQQAAYDAGLVGCDYPVEYGGGGRTDCQRIANEEMQRVGTPYFPNVIGLGMAAPTIYHHGSEQLKRELLPKLLSGEEISVHVTATTSAATGGRGARSRSAARSSSPTCSRATRWRSSWARCELGVSARCSP